MKKSICLLIIVAHLSGCATYESKSVSFRPPQDYANYQNTSGLLVGAESFADAKQAEQAFGFDVRAAGLLPVQVVIDNKSGQGVEVVAGQTFLIDETNRYWKILTNNEAADRVQKATDTGAIASGAGKGAAFGAAAGALFGLAIGIVSGRDVGSAVVKGGVLGGAGGAVIGGASKAGDDLTPGKAPHLSSVALDDRLAKTDLAVAANDRDGRACGRDDGHGRLQEPGAGARAAG